MQFLKTRNRNRARTHERKIEIRHRAMPAKITSPRRISVLPFIRNHLFNARAKSRKRRSAFRVRHSLAKLRTYEIAAYSQ